MHSSTSSVYLKTLTKLICSEDVVFATTRNQRLGQLCVDSLTNIHTDNHKYIHRISINHISIFDPFYFNPYNFVTFRRELCLRYL